MLCGKNVSTFISSIVNISKSCIRDEINSVDHHVRSD